MGTRSDGYGNPEETDARLFPKGFIPEVDGFRDTDLMMAAREPFSTRETPYFPDVTNRVLRMENREKEAVRALGKINQERLRRGGPDSKPVPWGPFWKEWKATHSMNDVSEGMSMEDELDNLPVY